MAKAKPLTEQELAAINGQLKGIVAAAESAGQGALAGRDGAQGLFEAGRVWEFTIMPGRAIDLYSRALALDPEHDDSRARLAINLLRAGRLEEGLRLAAALAAEKPDFRFHTIKGELTVTAMTLLGDALRVNNQLDEAMRAYEEALAFEPDDSHSAARLAELYLITGRAGRAAALEPQIDEVFNPELKAILRLAGNEPELLPAVTNIRLNAAVSAAVV